MRKFRIGSGLCNEVKHAKCASPHFVSSRLFCVYSTILTFTRIKFNLIIKSKLKNKPDSIAEVQREKGKCGNETDILPKKKV